MRGNRKIEIKMMEGMFSSCRQKQKLIKERFAACRTKEEIYQKIIDLGRRSPPLAEQYKLPANEVPGCQSVMHLRAYRDGEAIYFESESDALISSGLAVLLTEVYSGERPETVLKCPPDYLEEIGVSASLSPNRANGLYSIHLRMKQIALSMLTQR